MCISVLYYLFFFWYLYVMCWLWSSLVSFMFVRFLICFSEVGVSICCFVVIFIFVVVVSSVSVLVLLVYLYDGGCLGLAFTVNLEVKTNIRKIFSNCLIITSPNCLKLSYSGTFK